MGDVLANLPPMAWAAALLGYLLGAVPFGVILTRLAGAGDLRSIGSGNIGATNVLRTGHKGLAALTLLFDVLKGVAAIALAEYYWTGTGVWAALGAFVGHLYPIWLRFRGGKGIATLLGIALALYWPLALVFAGVWLGLGLVFRYSSLAGIGAAMAMPIAAGFMQKEGLIWLFCVTLLLVLWKHRSNISRLMAGTEPKIGKG